MCVFNKLQHITRSIFSGLILLHFDVSTFSLTLSFTPPQRRLLEVSGHRHVRYGRFWGHGNFTSSTLSSWGGNIRVGFSFQIKHRHGDNVIWIRAVPLLFSISFPKRSPFPSRLFTLTQILLLLSSKTSYSLLFLKHLLSLLPPRPTVPLSCSEGFTELGYYNGTVSQTDSGAPCLKWTEFPDYVMQYPGRGLGDHSYCRNPDRESNPWCFFRQNSGAIGWAYCDCHQGTFTGKYRQNNL